MTKHRSAAGVTVFDGQIYALGGHDGLSIFDSVSKRKEKIHNCFGQRRNAMITICDNTSMIPLILTAAKTAC